MRYLFLLIFLSLSFDSFCQQYTPFPTSDAIWRYRAGRKNWNFTLDILHDEQYMVDGDTTIKGKLYKKIMRRRHVYDSTWNGPLTGTYPYSNVVANVPDEFYAGFREDSFKVYEYNKWDTTERLAYDFVNIAAGASQIDSVQVGTKFHRRYKIPINSGSHYYVIEGIGYTLSFLNGVANGETHVEFLCFSHNGDFYDPTGKCSYIFPYGTPTSISEATSDKQLNVYPNPFSSELNIKSVDPVVTTVYNALGAIVLRTNEAVINTTQLSNGMYMVVVKDKAGGVVHTQKLIKE